MTLDKTKTIKKRTVNVYLPNLEMKNKWVKAAKIRKQSISGFIVETIEDTLVSEEAVVAESRAELIGRAKDLHEQVATLTKELHQCRTLLEHQEKELMDLRAGPFLDSNFKGTRQYPKALINLLRDRGKVRYEDLHSLLGITPGSDASTALQVQLSALEQYGIIEYSDRYIRWKG
jgi:hypothetical protein